MIVVYFNQQLGAIGCFTIQTLVEICIFKAEKGRISKKFDANYSKKCLFFKFALESLPGVFSQKNHVFSDLKTCFYHGKHAQKTLKKHTSTSFQSAQNPNTVQNIQHVMNQHVDTMISSLMCQGLRFTK